MRKLLSIVLAFAMMMACPVACFAHEVPDIAQNPHVLFLSSYGYEWDSIPKQLSGITDTLNGDAKIDYVFMETKRLSYEDVKDNIYEDVLEREQDEPYDYVIAADDAALQFVLEYRDELFSGIPVVFEGINSEDFATQTSQDPLITGIMEAFPLDETIGLAKKVNPDATRVVAVTDDSVAGQGSTAQFLDCEDDFPELAFSTIDCSKLTSDEIAEAVSACTSDTILVFLMMTADVEGNRYSSTEAIEYVTGNANTPVYKADELGIGQGALGGVVVSYHDMAASAAQIVLDLENGADISTIKVQVAPSYCVFDKQVMDQYGISESDISAAYDGDVEYLNREPPFIEEYGSVALPLVGIILLLVALMICAILIIRDKKKMMTQLSEKDQVLNSVLDNMPGGVMVIRLRRGTPQSIDTIYFSQGVPKLSGRTADEYRTIIDRDIFSCGIDENDIARFREQIADCVWKKEPVSLRFHQRHANGTNVWIAMSAVWGYDEKDGSRVYYAVFLDITQQEEVQRAEHAALEARASNEAKSDFLSNMSHDIRTPLNAVLGFTSLALSEPDVPSTVADYLQEIDVSGSYLLGLINDVLDMAKIESGKLELHEESVNVPELFDTITEVFEVQAAQKGVTLLTDFSQAQAPWIVLDALRVQQVYANLLSNAVKFSNSGTTIRWTVVETPSGPDTFRSVSTVSDQGCGMSEKFMETMFEPFAQDKPSNAAGGTGLGLSIVKNLVSLMEGTIRVESEPGKGSTFVVELEWRRGVPREHREHTAAPVSLDGYRVLLCEDNDINAVVTEKLLEAAGCTMDRAENGKIGIDRFRASAPDYYDAILMDIRMPVMGGLEATRALRTLDRCDAATIPIVAMSANAFEEDVEKSIDAGMNAHLAKPIDPQKLYETLAELISAVNQSRP